MENVYHSLMELTEREKSKRKQLELDYVRKAMKKAQEAQEAEMNRLKMEVLYFMKLAFTYEQALVDTYQPGMTIDAILLAAEKEKKKVDPEKWKSEFEDLAEEYMAKENKNGLDPDPPTGGKDLVKGGKTKK